MGDPDLIPLNPLVPWFGPRIVLVLPALDEVSTKETAVPQAK